MPVVSVTTQNQILAGWLGSGRAAGSPDSYSLELWAGDPRDAGSFEVSGGGYVAQTIDADDWNAPSGGQIQASSPVAFPDATDEYNDTATHLVLRDTSTTEIAFCAPLAEPLDVTGASGGPQITPIVFFADPD